MQHSDKGEMFNTSAPSNDNRIHLDYPEAVQSIGAVIAFVVVIIGWTLSINPILCLALICYRPGDWQ